MIKLENLAHPEHSFVLRKEADSLYVLTATQKQEKITPMDRLKLRNYLLAFEKTAKPAGDELVKLMSWALDHGQGFAAPLGYAPLPKALVAKMREKIGSIAAP
jgi:hypothetical protein